MNAKTKTQQEAETEFEKAREEAKEAYAHFLKAREHMQAAAVAAGVELKDSANEQLEEKLGVLKEKQEHMFETGSEYIRENPLKSAGLAFLSGYVVSRLLR